MTFSDQIRRAVRDSGLSRYRISLESGVDEASLCRFLQGEGITSTTLDALARVLRFRLDVQGPRAALRKRYGR